MNKKLLVFIVLLVSVLTLSGCGAADSEEYYDGDPYSDTNTDPIAPSPDPVTPVIEGGDIIQNNDAPALLNRKIIYTANLDMRSPTPEDIYNNVIDELATYSAYIESANITSTKYIVKVRVLSANFTDFVEAIKADGEVVSYSKSSEDVTNEYSTFEARKLALETQHARILELIEAATDLNTILQLEDTRMDLETELNLIGVSLANMDSLVDYSTINLTIRLAVTEDVVVPRTPTPSAFATEIGKNGLLLEVANNSVNPVKVYVDVYQNGEFVRQYESDAFGDSKTEFEITELDSNKEYTFKITSIEADYQVSHDKKVTIETDKTFFNRIGNVFTTSFETLVFFLEGVTLVVTALLPFAALTLAIFFPVRYYFKKRKKRLLSTRPIEHKTFKENDEG